jgi:hypothetical protein
MKADSMPAFDRFIRRAHARYVILRAVERTGLGIFAGCATMAILLPLLCLQGRPLLPITIGALILGGLVGLAWGVAARPNWLDTAMEADAQLDLADLLGTALQLRQSGDKRDGLPRDPWQLAVSATAEARCRGLSPGSVILNRLGARAWGGIGLATAFVLALGMIGTTPGDSHAAQSRAQNTSSPTSSQAPPELSDRPLLSSASQSEMPPVERDNDFATSRDGSIGAPVPPPSDSIAATSADPRRQSTPGQGDVGTSVSRLTDSRPNSVDAAVPRPISNLDRPESSSAKANPVRSASGVGLGQSRTDPMSKSDQSSAGAGAVSSHVGLHATPPWTSDHWESDIRNAQHELEAGQVPASYRAMVRQYFDRP